MAELTKLTECSAKLGKVRVYTENEYFPRKLYP